MLRSFPVKRKLFANKKNKAQMLKSLLAVVVSLHVSFPRIMTFELLAAERALVARGEVGVDRLYVLSHVVHVPAPLATQQALEAPSIASPLAVGLEVGIRIWVGAFSDST